MLLFLPHELLEKLCVLIFQLVFTEDIREILEKRDCQEHSERGFLRLREISRSEFKSVEKLIIAKKFF